MKKQILTTGLVALLLTGCAGEVELSQADSDRVAQYAANLVLKYDRNYKESLLSEKEIQEAKEKLRIAAEKEAELQALLATKNHHEQEETEESSGTATDGENVETEVAVTHTLQEVLNIPGCEIKNTGYSIVNEYPESVGSDEVVAVDVRAASGKKLLLMKYTITNNSTDNLECDLFSKDISSNITVNGSVKAESMLTMLLNDLGTLKVEIEAGGSYEAVQVFEVPEDLSTVEQIELNMNVENETFAIQL